MKDAPFFSIVIPTLNEAKFVPLLLKDLAKQTWREFEVIVVDGQSEDATVTRAQKVKGLPVLEVINSTKRHVSVQRNLGSKVAQGKWIIFMDADNRVNPSFLTDLQTQLTKHPTADVFTTWTNPDDDTQLSKAVSTALNMAVTVYELIGKPVCLGALIGCRREVMKKIRFDEKQKVFEDGLFIRSTIKKGYTFTIFHQPRFNYSLRRMRQEGTLQIAAKTARMQIAYLQGKDFKTEDFGYKMLGGQVYTLAKQTDDLFWKLPELLQEKAIKQFIKTKKYAELLQKYFS